VIDMSATFDNPSESGIGGPDNLGLGKGLFQCSRHGQRADNVSEG